MGLPAFSNQEEELNFLNQNIGGMEVPIPKQAIPTLKSQEEELGWLNRNIGNLPIPEEPAIPRMPEPKTLPAPAEPISRGAISAILPAIARGGAQFIQQIGEAGQALPIGMEETVFKPMIKKGEELMQRPEVAPSKEAQAGLRRWLETGIEQTIPSVGPQAAAALIGAGLGGPAGAAVGWKIGGQVTPVIFGLSQYQQAVNTARKQAEQEGRDPEKAEQDVKPYAVASGIIEWGFESAANWMEANIFLGGGQRVLTAPLKESIRNTLKPVLMNTAKKMGKAYGIEAMTEMMQAGGETYVESLGGIKHEQTPMEAAIDAIGPTLVMTTMFGIGTSHIDRSARKQLLQSISDPEANNRVDATRSITQSLKADADFIEKTDPETAQQYRVMADQWDRMTRDAVNRKQPIDIDQTIIEVTEVYKPTEKEKLLPFEEVTLKEKPAEVLPIEELEKKIQGQVKPEAEAIPPTVTPPPTPAPELKIPEIKGLKYNGIQEIPGKPDQHVFTDLETTSTFYTTDLSTKGLMAERDRIREKFEEAELPTPPKRLPAEQLRYLGEIQELRGLVEQGEPGWRMGGEAGTIAFGSTYPTFMKNMGWTKNEVLTAIDKGMAGEKLGVRQQEIWDTAKKEARGIFRDRIGEQKREKLQAIPTGDLEVGDQIKVRDEILTVTEKDEEKIIIKDGQKYELDPYFDTIQGRKIEGKKPAIEGLKPAEVLPIEKVTTVPEMVTPELSPIEKDQYKLPSIKIGVTERQPAEKAITLEGTPLMEAAIKEERERVQPALPIGERPVKEEVKAKKEAAPPREETVTVPPEKGKPAKKPPEVSGFDREGWTKAWNWLGREGWRYEIDEQDQFNVVAPDGIKTVLPDVSEMEYQAASVWVLNKGLRDQWLSRKQEAKPAELKIERPGMEKRGELFGVKPSEITELETARKKLEPMRPATEEELNKLQRTISHILPEGTPFGFVDEIWINTRDPRFKKSLREWQSLDNPNVVLPGRVRAYGQTFQWNTTASGLVQSIEVATKNISREEIESNSYHEAWHAIRTLLTKDEQSILGSRFKTEEEEADAFADFNEGKKKLLPLSLKNIFQKVKDFFDALGNYLHGMGFRSAEDIFGEALMGKITGQAREMRLARKESGIWEKAQLKLVLPQGVTNAKSENPEVEKRMWEAYGLDQASHIEKFKGQVFKFLHSFMRHFEHLSPQRFGKVIDILRRYEQVTEFSKKEASDKLQEIIGRLDKPRLNIFSRVLILNDLMKDYQNGLYDRSKPLPFGYKNIDEVNRDLTKFQAIAGANKDIQRALDARRKIWDVLRDELIDKQILPEAVKDDDRYFHHQVLQYMAIKAYYPGILERKQYTGLSPRDVRLHRKGWQIAREGSALDFNTNYLESEFEVFSQAVAQIETIKALDRIQEAEDISERLKGEAKKAGKTANDWKEFIPEGYTTWQPKKGFHFYMANTITDKVLEKLLAPQDFAQYQKTGKISIPGLGLADIDELSIRKAFAVGKRNIEWAIPIELQRTMDQFRDFKDEGPIFKASRAVLSSWKQWILLNPLRVLKYNFNNLSGDADISLAYNPKILTNYSYQAMRDLYADIKGQAIQGRIAEELREARRGGVIGSGITIHEIPDISKQGVFQILTGAKPNLVTQYWNTVKEYTNFRENVLRLASYRFFKDELKRGSKVYGASKPAEVDAVKDPEEKAAKLARELIGDYGNISHAGQWLRMNLIPFYSWIEINAPRYVRLIKNLKHEGKHGQMIGFGAMKAGKLGVKMLLLYGLVSLWNSTLFPDEEEELGRSGRRQLHLILGRRSDGTIRSIRFQGALSDALSWFGLEDFPEDFKEVMKGKVPWEKKLEEALLAGPEKLFHGARPIEKAGMEILAGKSFYPEMRKPKPIRDKIEHMLRTVNLDLPYKYITGKPVRGVIKDLESILTLTTDPGEAAYYDIVNRARDFLEEQGQEVPAFTPTEKSNILYYYKQAQKMGDRKAAQKFMEKYIESGGTKQDLMKSIKKSHPLGMLPLDYRKMFIGTLDEADQRTLGEAIDWWQKLYGG